MMFSTILTLNDSFDWWQWSVIIPLLWFDLHDHLSKARDSTSIKTKKTQNTKNVYSVWLSSFVCKYGMQIFRKLWVCRFLCFEYESPPYIDILVQTQIITYSISGFRCVVWCTAFPQLNEIWVLSTLIRTGELLTSHISHLPIMTAAWWHPELNKIATASTYPVRSLDKFAGLGFKGPFKPGQDDHFSFADEKLTVSACLCYR